MKPENNMKIIRIMVTGSTGFLGSRICAHFRNRAENPPGMECESEVFYEVLSPAHTELEITDLEKTEAFFGENAPDILIHCAAVSDVGKCGENPVLSYAINVTGAENLAKACKKMGTKMIFCSSDQVYFSEKRIEDGVTLSEINAEDSGIKSHKETECVMPYNTYGKQKLEAENRILAVCEDAVCLRLSWMYDTKQLLACEHGNFYRNVKEVLKRGEACSFPTHDVRGITYVKSVVENLPEVFSLPGGVYNYGAENSMNTYELVRTLFEKIGVSQQYIMPNEQAFSDNPRNISMDISKIRGYGIDFEDTLDKLVEEWK